MGSVAHAGRWVALGWLALACASTAPVPTPDVSGSERAPPPPASAFERALASARQKRDEAVSRPAPTYAGDGEKASCLRFIQTEVAAWIRSQKPEVEDAVVLYDRALQLATNDLERGTAFLEIARTTSWFADDFLRAGDSALPTSLRADARMTESFRNVLRDTVMSRYDQARAATERCVELRGLDGSSPVRRECSELLQRLPRKKLPEPETPRFTADGSLETPSRPHVPTRHPTACTFGGSLRVKAKAFGSELASAPVASLDGIYNVEVEELLAPAAFGKRAQVRLAWPLSATLWLEENTELFTLAERVDVVKGFVFLEPGHEVRAAAPAGDALQILASFPGGAGGARAEPPRLEARVRCAALELKGRSVARRVIAGEWLKTRDGSLALFERPDGRKVARFEAGGTFVLERQGGWVKVAGVSPFGYEGWAHARDIESEEGPFGFLAALSVGHTHRVTKPFPVRSSLTGNAPLGTLAVGAPLRLGKTLGDQIEVFSVSGLVGSPGADGKPAPWYALAADVAASTEAVPHR